jgi:hypothetical protein
VFTKFGVGERLDLRGQQFDDVQEVLVGQMPEIRLEELAAM